MEIKILNKIIIRESYKKQIDNNIIKLNFLYLYFFEKQSGNFYQKKLE